jgi:hypothetical protein
MNNSSDDDDLMLITMMIIYRKECKLVITVPLSTSWLYATYASAVAKDKEGRMKCFGKPGMRGPLHIAKGRIFILTWN